jgi:hypothetical protein
MLTGLSPLIDLNAESATREKTVKEFEIVSEAMLHDRFAARRQ